MQEQTLVVESFNVQSGARSKLGGETVVNTNGVALPASIVGAPDNSFFVLMLSSGPHAVEVFLKKSNGAVRIVGIERT